MKVVLVTGGREYRDIERVFAVLDEEAPLMVVEGGADGADALAGRWAHSRDVWQLRCPAEWSRLGKAAGPRRNTEMVAFLHTLRRLDHECSVVAFPGGRGTADCVRQARAMGFAVREVPS